MGSPDGTYCLMDVRFGLYACWSTTSRCRTLCTDTELIASDVLTLTLPYP